MKNNRRIGNAAVILLALVFCMISCERTEIKPETSGTSGNPDAITNTSPSDRLVGTWVRYWDSDRRDTLKFYNDGVFVYTLGEDNANPYIDQYFYECTNNFLLNFKDFSNYYHETHYIKFYEDNTLLELGNFTFLPVDVDVVYSVLFRKID